MVISSKLITIVNKCFECKESSHDQEQLSSQQHLNDGHCITSRTKRHSSTRAEDRYLEMELLDPKDLSFPLVDHDDYFVAQQFNVTNAIYEFQCSVLRQKWKLSIKDHIHHAMAINSILLLSPTKYSDNLSPHFCEANLRATIDQIKFIYGLNSPHMQIKTELDIEAISRSQAIVKLLQLDLLPDERKFANGLVELVKKLPRVPVKEDVNESELNIRFVDPFLCGLFDDPEEDVFLRWTNDITFEARKNETLWVYRPDLTITSLKGVNWSTSHGYGEVKSVYHEANNFLLSKDLIRVAIFCKNALNAHNLEGVLGALQLPNNLCDLRKLLMDMPLALLVLDVFH
ncbi:MAG: hypothetical protein EXX96DRAFT_599675 [Benjaminiella poitrasii]|nr:MAG: hypothetical protein EXX96DRAFT_599675 [Benjaminiella poitrasii]